MARVTENGEPDPSFSTAPANGVRVIDVPGSAIEQAYAVKVLANETIVIGGAAEQGAFLAELDAEGNLVSGFGTGGVAVENLGSAPFPSGLITDLKVLPDGRHPGHRRPPWPPTKTKKGSSPGSPPAGNSTRASRPAGSCTPTPPARMTPWNRSRWTMRAASSPPGFAGNGNALGDTWLLRLTPDGHLDPAFGSGGETDANAGPRLGVRQWRSPFSRTGAPWWPATPFEGSEKLLVGRFTADPEPVRVSVVPAKARCAGRSATIVGTGAEPTG